MKEGNMKRILRDERGMALAVAIFALVVVGALVAGAFFAGTQEQRVGENQRRVQTSFGVAEAGVQEQVLNWNSTNNNKRPTYPPDSVAIASQQAPNGTGTYFGYSYKMGPNVFLLNVVGRDKSTNAGATAGGAGAQQRIGLITRIAPVDFNIHASLTTQGSVKVGGNAAINGADQVPTGWASCDPPGSAQAGVRDQGGQVTSSGNSTVTGTPPIVNDQSINNNTFTTFGGATFAQLAARAPLPCRGATIRQPPFSTAMAAAIRRS